MFAATKTFASIVNRRQAEPQAGEMTALLLDRLAHGGALSGPEQAVGGSVFNGTLSLAELRAGFFLHRTDIAYLRGLTSRFPLTKSGIKIVFKLQGGGRLRIGPLALPVAVPPGGGPGRPWWHCAGRRRTSTAAARRRASACWFSR
ncbi:hypothetical protein [Diaphorobacter nitroreducens]|uniref:hypothetical protein n=1 Tax=Diaphorobacter nitroreducens TaxID=164759 RepID=UPI001E32332A|nr:hypothetical protein [Diaphorobacter nitroreducens]